MVLKRIKGIKTSSSIFGSLPIYFEIYLFEIFFVCFFVPQFWYSFWCHCGREFSFLQKIFSLLPANLLHEFSCLSLSDPVKTKVNRFMLTTVSVAWLSFESMTQTSDRRSVVFLSTQSFSEATFKTNHFSETFWVLLEW